MGKSKKQEKRQAKPGYAICPKCGEEKPATKEFFFINEQGVNYKPSNCKACYKKYAAKWRETSKSKSAKAIREQAKKAKAKKVKGAEVEKSKTESKPAVEAIVTLPEEGEKHPLSLVKEEHENKA